MTAGAAFILWLLAGDPESNRTESASRDPIDVLTLQVTVDPIVATGADEGALLRHLSVELAASRIEVVRAGAATGPTDARLAITATADGRTVSLDVTYLSSGTAVRRLIDLSALRWSRRSSNHSPLRGPIDSPLAP